MRSICGMIAVRGLSATGMGYDCQQTTFSGSLSLSGGSMIHYAAYLNLSPTTLADVLTRDRVMDMGIRPLWQPIPGLPGLPIL